MIRRSGERRRKSTSLLSALICALLFAFPVALFASSTTPGLRADMERALKDEGLTGAVWATVTPDGAVAVDAAGVKDARSGEALTPDNRVHVGSVVKTLLATGVLRLVTESRLVLDTPISDLLPDLVFDNPWAASDPIRLRHLLDHTAGLDDARFWQVFSLKPDADTSLADAFIGDPSLLRVRSRPGRRFSYSNMGYSLLGMIVESITGERYERYLDAHLLRPLAMNDSSFAFVSQVGPQADARLAMGHFEDGVTQAAAPIYLRPAGQFTTTAMDMAVFARFLMGDGSIDGEPFIDAALLRAMGRPKGTEAAQAGLLAGYGLGLSRRDRHGVIGRCHDGSTVGYRAMLCLFPEQHKAFFSAINTDSETADYGRFDALLIRALDVDAAVPTLPGAPTDSIADWEGIYVPAPNRFASFAWLDTVLNFIRVRWDGTHLHLKPFQSDGRVLTPMGGLLFRAAGGATTSHVLLRSSDGTRVISDGLQSYEQVPLAKIVPLWISLVAGLSGLIYILVSGVVRLLMGRLAPSRALFVPFLAVIALSLPLPFYLQQSFLQLGDATVASVLLAAVTGALPLAMVVGLVFQFRRRTTGVIAALDVLAMLAVLQWTIVLAGWNLLPFRLWV
ncbi:MAG: beta-lactamase family protein [Gammaproteobacteria bacterium]|nr:beta-lactamase family protein [Gammaproteobacteria bacterium]